MQRLLLSQLLQRLISLSVVLEVCLFSLSVLVLLFQAFPTAPSTTFAPPRALTQAGPCCNQAPEEGLLSMAGWRTNIGA